MYFKLVLTLDRRPNLVARAWDSARTIHTYAGTERRLWQDLTHRETRFWNDLQRVSTKSVGASASREKMREDFAKELRTRVVNELTKDYAATSSTSAQGTDAGAKPDDPSSGAAGPTTSEPARPTASRRAPEPTETTKAIEGIRFIIKSIRGGSLEVLLFVLGFAKLVEAIGITPEEFSKYMDIVAPTAMSSIFGVTSGAIAADTTPIGDAGQVVGESGGTPALSPRVEPSMASLYFMPALFAAVAFGAAMYAFVQISSRLVDERAAYGGYLHDQMKDILNERREIADKLATLITQHDSALAVAQKTLFDDQMTLLKNASAAVAARDNAIVDLVKARLIPTPPEPKTSPEPKPPVLCALDEIQVRNVQAVLVERLLYRGEPDGLWGPDTEDGVSRFQSRMNLPVTGKVDLVTASRLGIPCKSP